MRLTGIAAVAAALCLGSPALAGVGEDAAAAQSAPVTAHQLALSRRYVDMMQGDQLRALVRTMVEAQTRTQGSQLPDEDRRFITDLTVEIVGDLVPAMMDELVPVYAATFTEAELEALLAFYGSDEGRSIITKTFTSMSAANEAIMLVIPRMLDKMATRMCDHYGCDPIAARAEMYAGAGLPLPDGAPAPARRK